MDCSQCLENNQLSIQTKGYGFNYIGYKDRCLIHTPDNANHNADSVRIKWTDGNPYERTARNNTKTIDHPDEMSSSAYSCSLNHDEHTWDMLNQSLSGFTVSNKREQLGNKLASRDMVQQIGFNPFLETNYVDDISIRDKFLKPINTTEDITKSPFS